MNPIQKFFHRDRTVKALENLIEESSPTPSYYFMICMSTGMASLGLIMDSIPVLIGSMVVAPFIYSLLRVSLGIVITDARIFWRSTLVTIKSVLIAIVISTVLGVLFSYYPALFQYISEMVAREALWPSFVVSLIAGATGTYAFMQPKVDEVLPGVAISVSLIPPLAAVGIGLSQLNLTITSGAAIMSSINILGIVLSSIIVFVFFGVENRKKVMEELFESDEKERTRQSEEG